jgi:hypothetical protein
MASGTLVRLVVLATLSCLAAFAQAGRDIDSAIRLILGQTFTDIGDSTLRPQFVFVIGLARGQEFTATVRFRDNQQWRFGLSLLAPDKHSVLARACARTSGCPDKITYIVPETGDYFLVLEIGERGAPFTFQTEARGIPLDAPPPAIKECVTGEVTALTYSLLSASINLVDDAEIGTTRMCATCPLKVPVYPNLVEKLYTAYQLQASVEACFDDGGQLVRLKLQKPPAVVR